MGIQFDPGLDRDVTRRRVLGLLGAGGVAALVAAVPGEARAGHDGTTPLHLGEFNVTPGGGAFDGGTLLTADAGSRVLDVRNTRAGGDDTGAVQAWSRGGAPAVQGNATTDLEFPPTGAGVGILGISGSGPGVAGFSDSGHGVEGHNASGVAAAVRGSSHDGPGVEGTSDTNAGVVGSSHTNAGVLGNSELNGVAGNSPAGNGVAGFTNEGTGVLGVSDSGDGAAGLSQTGVGVRGVGIDGGTGVDASSPAGIALAVHGVAAFSSGGTAVVPTGEAAVEVAHPGVTAASHVTVTLTGDPGSRAVRWVERLPGTGFVVHLTPAPRRARPATPLTYLVVEPTHGPMG